jgi:hypothetical protein
LMPTRHYNFALESQESTLLHPRSNQHEKMHICA